MIENLTGTWKVRIKKGSKYLKLLNLVGDKKVITGHRGHNVAAGFWPWGSFKIKPTSNGIYEFIYSDGKILDVVFATNVNEIHGTFYHRKSRNKPFRERGWFVMTRLG